METILVFVIATAASYLAIHWTLTNLVAYWELRYDKYHARRLPSGRSEFITFLRREALSRVSYALTSILHDAVRQSRSRPVGFAQLDYGSVARLKETRKLLAPLFTRQDVALYDLITSALVRVDIANVHLIEEKIEELRARMGEQLGDATEVVPTSLWGKISHVAAGRTISSGASPAPPPSARGARAGRTASCRSIHDRGIAR
jgi:hypothetical protein